METMMTLKPSQERKLDWYDTEISCSEADKALVLQDLSAFMKQLLEKQGQKVRRVVVSTEFEKLAQAAVMKGEVVPALIAHVVYPDNEWCLWICV